MQDEPMFAFDRWGDWLKDQAAALCDNGLDAVFRDGRHLPELATNPSYGLEVLTPKRAGSMTVWANGLCDIEVFDTTSGARVEDALGLEAVDETVPHLFARFRTVFSPAVA